MRKTEPSAVSGEPPPDFESLQQAAEWFAVLRWEHVTPQERSAWEAWLAKEARHRNAWRFIESVNRRFEPLQTEEEKRSAAAALKAVQGKGVTRRGLLTLAILGGTGLLTTGVLSHLPVRATIAGWTADYRTATGEVREIDLADGTHVWLNTASAMNVDYQQEWRKLRLLAGEMLIQTAKEARPFVVDTSQGQLRALGTRFTVRQTEDVTFVAVYEGAVQIRTGESDMTQIVPAGKQVLFTSTAIEAMQPVDSAREVWAQGVLLADNLPLKDLIAELGRYRHAHLSVAPDVADLRVMGTFPATDPERTLAMLEQALPVRVQRTLPWWIAIEAHASGED